MIFFRTEIRKSNFLQPESKRGITGFNQCKTRISKNVANFNASALSIMRTILNDFIKNGKYPSPLKFNKIPVTKEEEVELNKDENQTKSQLLALIDENISNLPEELIQYFEDEKKILKIKTAKKECYIRFS